MKKAAPFIIGGIILVLIIVLWIRNKKAQAADGLDPSRETDTNGAPSGGGFEQTALQEHYANKDCPCARDPLIEKALIDYNALNTGGFSLYRQAERTRLRGLIQDSCPCAFNLMI